METSTPATPDKKDIVLVAMKVVTKCLIYAWLLFMLVFPAIVSYMYFPEAIVAYVPYFLVIIILTIFSFLRYKKIRILIQSF